MDNEDEDNIEDETDDRTLIANLMVELLSRLFHAGLLDVDRIDDDEYIHSVAIAHPQISDDLSMVVNLHESFVEAASDEVECERYEVAVVLVATAIEQSLNVFYREVLDSTYHLPDENITEAIRSNNLAPKIGWLFRLVTGIEFDSELRNLILRNSEFRNQIVHYKAIPSKIKGMTTGSWFNIKKQIAELDVDGMLELPYRVDTYLQTALTEIREKDQIYCMARKAAEVYVSQRTDFTEIWALLRTPSPET